MIGARWKYSNVWSRSVLIVPSTFYVLSFIRLAVSDERNALTSYWCLSYDNSTVCLTNALQFTNPNYRATDYGHRLCRPSWVGVIGAHGARETPVPMPNTAVKPRSGYNTWDIKPWENSTVPNYKKSFRIGSSFSFCHGFDDRIMTFSSHSAYCSPLNIDISIIKCYNILNFVRKFGGSAK